MTGSEAHQAQLDRERHAHDARLAAAAQIDNHLKAHHGAVGRALAFLHSLIFRGRRAL